MCVAETFTKEVIEIAFPCVTYYTGEVTTPLFVRPFCDQRSSDRHMINE